MIQKELHGRKAISLWLKITLFLVLFMVFVGGVTRLTDSGLSMVEWRPLMGALPPLSDQEWERVYRLYQQYPEYKVVNQGMSLSEFKFIFFWEYFHRLTGRLIGLVFALPFFGFLLAGKLNGVWIKRLLLALLLGGSQGLLGWYMVKSGLVDRPDVSHYRLAAHFSLALIIMGYLYLLILRLKRESKIAREAALPRRLGDHLLGAWIVMYGFCSILAAQIVYGAFVAGLKAGVGFNTFPKMGKRWFPEFLFRSEDLAATWLESNAGVQFVHRWLGILLFCFALSFLIWGLTKARATLFGKNLVFLSGGIFLQFFLGVMTLLSTVELSLASAHQMGACLVVLLTIKTLFDLSHTNEVNASDKTGS